MAKRAFGARLRAARRLKRGGKPNRRREYRCAVCDAYAAGAIAGVLLCAAHMRARRG